MPDLQSELSKVIDEWSEPQVDTQTKPHLFSTTKGTSRATAEYILANSGKNRKEIVDAMVGYGHNRMSVYALLTQMKRQELVREVNGGFYATYTKYTPLKSYAAWKNSTLKTKTRTPKEKLKPVQETRAEPAMVVPLPTLPSAEAMLANMSVAEAYKLYGELHKMFGSAK